MGALPAPSSWLTRQVAGGRTASRPARASTAGRAPGHDPGDALARELQDHSKRLTAPYKYSREIRFVDELPKTVSGKIRRPELRERSGRQAS